MHPRSISPILVLGLLACGGAESEPPKVASPAPRCSAEQIVAPPTTPAPSAATPEVPPIPPLAAQVLAGSEAYATVQSLTDEVGARLTGSPASKLAVAWGVRTMQAIGLDNVHTEAVRAPHWERGEESGAIVAPTHHPVVLKALGGSVGTPAKGLEAEVVEVGSIDELEKKKPDEIRGKVVFFYRVMRRSKDGSGYGEAVGVRGRGAIAAAKLGAVGVVIRSIGTDNNRVAHTGGMRYDDKVPKIPAAALSIPDADLLHRIVALGRPVRFSMRLGAKALPETDTANVIGDIVGDEAPNEIVLFGAHLDSWDVGQGAIDDGAGCAVILEAARQIRTLPMKPKRTLRFVLFANEENGLAGARAYAKAHEAELDKHVLAAEADLGAGRVYEARFLGGEDKRAAFERLTKDLPSLGIAISAEEAEGGADLSTLRAAGVPVFDLRQDASVYFDHHHTENDTLDKIDKADLDSVAAAYTLVAQAAGYARDDFGRVPEKLRAPRW